MKALFYAAFCFFFLAVPFSGQARDYSALHEMFKQAYGNDEKICAFIDRISREIEQYPQDGHLRSLRVTAYNSFGDFYSAKPDVEFIVALTPDSPAARFILCTYEEATGADKESYLACYARVAEMYEEQGMATDDSLNYLYALLLAESPKAETVRERYLSTLSDSPWDQDLRATLENFSRTMLATRLGPDHVRHPCAQKR